MAKTHFLWEGYKSLTQMRRLTEDEAIETLEDIWPGYPVRELVRAEGDERKALQLLHGTGQDTGTAQEGAASGSEDMNTIIRGRARKARAQPEDGQQAAGQDDDFIRRRFTARYQRQGQDVGQGQG
jgi:hypothetical protein